MPNFERLSTTGEATAPLLVHIPHSSTSIPDQYRGQFLLSEPDLDRELLAMTDHYTRDLFAEHAINNAGSAFVNGLSRLVFDPERFEDDALEEMSQIGMGAVYMSTSELRPLRRSNFSADDREEILKDLFRPYAQALSTEVSKQLDRFGRCLILDAHSFPSTPLPYEDSALSRPDLCIGYDGYHAPDSLISALESTGRRFGWTVGRNTPFAGSYVPLAHYGTDRRVVSVMLELNRSLYMDEATGERAAAFEATKERAGRLLETALLFEAFRNARFHADIPGGNICIQIGEQSPELEALLKGKGHKCWAYITAHNPSGQRASDAANDRAQDKLAQELRSLGLAFYPGEGKADIGDWPAEPSLLIIGVTDVQALELGGRYGQAAVVVGESNMPARLLVCHPE